MKLIQLEQRSQYSVSLLVMLCPLVGLLGRQDRGDGVEEGGLGVSSEQSQQKGGSPACSSLTLGGRGL